MHQPSEAGILDDLQTRIGALITEFTSTLASLVTELTTTQQRGLGFATYDAIQAQNAAVRSERNDLAALVAGSLSRGVLPSEGYVTGAGESPNPGNLAGINVDALIWATLLHNVRQLVADQVKFGHYRGWCTWPPVHVPTEPAIGDLLVALRALVWQSPNMALLHAVHRDLTNLRDEALRLVDGNDKTILAAPCPHCGNRTLVVYFATDTIRCDRHPKTGRFEPCTCPDPLCACKERPREHRHEWYRAKGARHDGWYTLDRLINPDRDTSERLGMLRDLGHEHTEGEGA